MVTGLPVRYTGTRSDTKCTITSSAEEVSFSNGGNRDSYGVPNFSRKLFMMMAS